MATYEVPVFIWGGSMSGVVAGVAAARRGVSVRGAEMMPWLGGLVPGGLGLPDFVGSGVNDTCWGITREFFLALEAAAIADGAVEDSGVLDPNGVPIGYGRHPNGLIRRYAPDWARTARDNLMASVAGGLSFAVDREIAAVTKDSVTKRITSVTLTNGDIYVPQNCIDASYEKDLARLAGVPITYGRESVATYNEFNAGYSPQWQLDTTRRVISARGDTWKWYTHPPFGQKQGQADYKNQADNFRMTLSTESGRREFLPPTGTIMGVPKRYNPEDFKSFIDETNVDSLTKIEHITSYQSMTAGLHTTNGNDWPGGSWYYQRLRTKAERMRYIADLYYRHAGIYYTAATSLAVPSALRANVLAHGLPATQNGTEYIGQQGWSAHPYIRNTARIKGPGMLTFKDMVSPGRNTQRDPVSTGGYGVDRHAVNSYPAAGEYGVREGHAHDEGRGYYQITQRSLTPHLGNCSNLLVVQGPAISEVFQASQRMEPTFMVTGESAGIAVARATELGIPVGLLPYSELRPLLDAKNARLNPV